MRLESELRLNGEVIQTGPVLKPGEELDLAYTVHQRGYGPQTEVSPVIAGSFLHLAVAGGSVSPAKLENLRQRITETKTRLESEDPNQIASLTRGELLGDLFQSGGLGYFAQFDAMGQVQARQQDARQVLAPSAGTYGYEPNVAYLFGVPNAIEPGSMAMDMDRVAWVQGQTHKTETSRRQRNIETGALSSTLEHAVIEQIFSTQEERVDAISAIKALDKANRQGQRIYRITERNRDSVLPKLNHKTKTMDEIRSALNAGKEVTTHTDPVSVPGWQGAGYVILDEASGDGAWKIGGGKNGAKGKAEYWGTAAISLSVMAGLLVTALTGGIFAAIFALIIFAYEVYSYAKWLANAQTANNTEEASANNFDQFMVALLGFVPALGLAELYIARAFAVIIGELLTANI